MKMIKIIFGIFVFACAGATNAQSASVPLMRPTFPGQLNQGKIMVPEETINSPSGTYSLRFNSDGSLGLYQNSNNARVWIAKGDSGTSFGDTVSFLQDTPQNGNKWTECFGLGKNGSYVNKLFKSCQISSVRGKAGGEAYLAVQDDGNLVVYAMSQAWKADGKYVNGYQGIVFPMGTSFSKGSSFSTGGARLDFSTSGNLEIYTNGALTWQSGTAGSGEFAVMQGDGNFVIYNAAGNAVWNTNTSGRTDAYLALGPNGALNIIARVAGSQGILWHR